LCRKPPFCLRRRRVVFLLSRTFLRNKYAATSRTIPFTISRTISRNVSMIITSFPKGKKSNNQPPSQYPVALLFYHIPILKNAKGKDPPCFLVSLLETDVT